MVDTSFLPTLSPFDVERAAQLIQQAYAPPTPNTSPDGLRRLQQELFEIQKKPEAWGLVIPLLDHQDQNVQFFGAHTAQVKIARDWDSFPQDHAPALRDLMLQLTAHSLATGRSKFILRKLFVALTSLALKLVPGHPTRWPEWIIACVTAFSGCGAPPENIHDFLAIVAEEVGNADLLGSSKAQVQQSMTDAIALVVQAITSSIAKPPGVVPPREIQSALRSLQAWMSQLPSSNLTSIIPVLISLLDPSADDDTAFIASSDALQEIMSKSALSDGSGSKTLTEPLLLWLDSIGSKIVETTLSTGAVDEVSHSLCKLLVALGDHSTSYIAANIASPALSSSTAIGTMAHAPNKTRGHLTQTFLRLLLAYTGLPGYYGVDEEESEMTLGFWYLLQEALWSTDFYFGDGDGDTNDDGAEAATPSAQDAKEAEQVTVAKAVYIELVQVLRRKVAFPGPGDRSAWSKDQIDKFQVYRRDVGDTLINAYYVLRDDMLGYYVNDIAERLAAGQEHQGWQEIEATLHCIGSVQEALDMEKAPHLSRLFSPEILGRLPSAGHSRIRRTALGVIGTYSSWFASQPNDPPHTLLMTVLGYVVSALTDPLLCLQGAVALRNLCDANRKALAPQIAAFGELHAGLERIPDSEKSKVLQSIASVIQALPPDEEIPLIEAIVNPIIHKLAEALRSAATLPDDSRNLAILQLETLSGVARGLTRTTDGLLAVLDDDDSSPQARAEAARIEHAREDGRMVRMRAEVFAAISSVVEIWSGDAGVGHALSDLLKSITALPADTTLLTLPAGPLLQLVCLAAQRQLTAAWLSLAAILIAQLGPSPFALTLDLSVSARGATEEARGIIEGVLPTLVGCALGVLGVHGAMESNPDIVQEFFACMDRVAQDFTGTFYSLPPGALDALMQCAITALSLQERYSLVAACNFMITITQRTAMHDSLAPHAENLLQTHGRAMMRAVLVGFAGVAPRSVVPNLIEILGMLLGKVVAGTTGPGRAGGGAGKWMKEILYADDFVPSKAGADVKEKFIKAVLGARSVKKTRDAAQQFTLVARGLEGSSFGYASVSM